MAATSETSERAAPHMPGLLRNALLMLACLLLVRLGLTTADDHPLIATFAPAVVVAGAGAGHRPGAGCVRRGVLAGTR